ncbi:MAG: c-type cytochrome [Acidobacteriales bacterium]|nr:c-type cytochrome [Terriglobales bacterium]
MGKLVSALVVLIALLAAAISLTIGWRPFIGAEARPLTSRQFERTQARLDRGRYIFHHLAACVDCHSPHDPSKDGAPVVSGAEGSGEVMPFDGLPGRVVAPNITPDTATGAGTWSDDQLARAIREGIGHDGRALFPMMPYSLYRNMSDEDLASVVVYIRSMPPVAHQLPGTEIVFPVKYLMRSAPRPVTEPVSAPPTKDPILWGRYLTTSMASCGDCHTPRRHGEAVAGMDFAGGNVFSGEWGHAASANITPDASGINYYDEALFIQVMRTGKVRARALSPIMPYEFYGGLSDDDLKAIFAYLHSVKPVRHIVDNTEPPTNCRLCRMKHGGGDRN